MYSNIKLLYLTMEIFENPFGINNYIDPDHFCNREWETKQLLSNIRNNNHTAFFALRRLGKTALIKHIFYLVQKQKNQKCIYIDIFATQNLKDLTNLLANTIYSMFSEKKGIGQKFLEAIKLFRPVLSIDPLTGDTELSLDITKAPQYEKTIPQLLHFLDTQDVKIVIAIDEFQQILNYPETNVEAILRTVMQSLKNTTFLFCGSNQAMMQEIFNNTKRPFYSSCSSIHLQKIEENEYARFIQKIFTQYKYKISDELIYDILAYTKIHTYYTQYFCNQLFAQRQKNITALLVQHIKYSILENKKGDYFQYRNLLTPTQWKLLVAIGKEEIVTQPYNKAFISKYKLGSPAITKRSLDALVTKEMVYKNTNTVTTTYAVYDKFLMRWLQYYMATEN